MQDFTYCNPTKVIFGKGTVSSIGRAAKDYGKKVLFVSGRSSIRKSGLYDTVYQSLQENGLEIVDFPGVRSNPVLSHLREGIELAKSERIDFILAVGGGSVLDESKAIAAGAMTDADVWDFFTGSATIKEALPVLTVLTNPASGSEMNGGMVITNEETRQKFGFSSLHVYPKASILDPMVTFSIPANYTAYSAVDAISHLLEGYFTHRDKWAPIQDRNVEGLVKTIMETTEGILLDPTDYQARATMMWAATLAWNGLSIAGVGRVSLPSHMLEHPLSAIYDIPHGAGLSIVIPAWMKFASGQDNGKFVQFARNVFNIRADNNEQVANAGIAALKDWFQKIGSTTSFTAAGIPASDIDLIAGNALSLRDLWHIEGYTKEIIAGIYEMCL